MSELDGRLAYLIPNPNRDLNGEERKRSYFIQRQMKKEERSRSLTPSPRSTAPKSTTSEVWVGWGSNCCLCGRGKFTHLLEHFYFGAETLYGLVILAFEVICEMCACIGCGV